MLGLENAASMVHMYLLLWATGQAKAAELSAVSSPEQEYTSLKQVQWHNMLHWIILPYL